MHLPYRRQERNVSSRYENDEDKRLGRWKGREKSREPCTYAIEVKTSCSSSEEKGRRMAALLLRYL